MSEPLDRLFREKLAGHRVTPADAVWSRIGASLDEKKKGIIWFRAAAAIILLGMLALTALWLRQEDAASDLTNADSVIQQKPASMPVEKKSKLIPNDEPKLPVVNSPTRKVKVFIAHEDIEEADAGAIVQHEQPVIVVQETSAPPATQQASVESVIKPAQSITLTFTLASIPMNNERTVVENRNGIQKVMDAARDAKHSEGALAELRIIKDDLFALNFKKKK